MISDLDKYGFVALTIVVVLILFIALKDMQEENDLGLNGIYFDDSLVEQEEASPKEEEVLVVLDEPALDQRSRPASEGGDFNFLEDPVIYPGKAAGQPDRGLTSGGTNRYHKIAKGETLSSISMRYYGSTKWWKTIAEKNPQVNPKRLMIGQRIRIPELESSPSATRSVTKSSGRDAGSKPGSDARQYKVMKGDTLGKIARRFYGNAGRWQKIYTANQNKISDPKKLPVGIVLSIPQ
ncbi:MAG: LysM peptidoglycan-binding domain-containing protein [Planctomycetota bacterium]|jgi:nucleoid-associated protein YgaU